MSEKEFNANVQGFSLSVVTPEIAVKNNVDQLVAFIENRVKDYDPAKYEGDADKAKKDRTELNKGAEQVKSIRQQIQALNPYGEVIEKLAGAEKLIKSGSDALAVIVKARECKSNNYVSCTVINNFSGIYFYIGEFTFIKHKS